MRVQINTFNSQQHKTAKSKTTAERTALLADATNAKNPFLENALPVHHVCAQAANKILAYCHSKLISVLPLYNTYLVMFDLLVLFC